MPILEAIAKWRQKKVPPIWLTETTNQTYQETPSTFWPAIDRAAAALRQLKRERKLGLSLDNREFVVQTLRKARIGSLLGDARRKHLQALAPSIGEIESSAIERSALRLVKISAGNFGLAVIAILFYPPLLLATLPWCIYNMGVIYGDVIDTYRKHRSLHPALLSVIASIGFLIGHMFFTAAVQLCLATLVRYWVLRTEDHSKRSLFSLFGDRSSTVWIVTDDGEIEIPLERVQRDDIAVVEAGQIIPVDGVIVNGISSIDQHMLTGEAQPAEKMEGDTVLASTVVLSGKIHIRVEKRGEETVAAQIGLALDRTTDFKKTIQSRSDAYSGKMVLPMLALSGLALPFGGINSATALFMNVPAYKMRYFGPMGMLNFLNIGARQGILIKDGRSLELLNDVDTIIFDKTGTLTLEAPYVHEVYCCYGLSADQLLTYAAAAERRQTHPIAYAILAEARERQLQLPTIDDMSYEIGYGIKVRMAEQIVRVGSERFMELNKINIPDSISERQAYCHRSGYSLVMIALGNELIGAIELRPALRPEAKQVVHSLQKRGLELIILSGDHEAPTQHLAQELGIQRYFAQVLPEGKANLVAQLQDEGRSVCFVGDGINDAIALKQANISISLRGATTIATDTAQIVLMDASLSQLERAFELAKEYDKTLRSSLYISTFPGILCIGGVFLFGWSALATVIISNCVSLAGVTNVMLPLLNSVSRVEDTDR